jgi:hypothetical protein
VPRGVRRRDGARHAWRRRAPGSLGARHDRHRHRPPTSLHWGNGWAATFDALLALHRGDLAQAEHRLAADIDDPVVFGHWNSGLWRPWYAALWAEAAGLDDHPDAAERIGRSRHAARDNPIATAIVERAAARAARDYDRLVRFAITFAQLGCPYQQARTGRLAADLR